MQRAKPSAGGVGVSPTQAFRVGGREEQRSSSRVAQRPPRAPLSRRCRAPTRESTPLTSAPHPYVPVPLSCSSRPVEAPRRRRPGPLARFTSKCRKMSQNVALFQTPTRRMPHFTSKKPHVFGRNPAILANSAHFVSIRRRPLALHVCGESEAPFAGTQSARRPPPSLPRRVQCARRPGCTRCSRAPLWTRCASSAAGVAYVPAKGWRITNVGGEG